MNSEVNTKEKEFELVLSFLEECQEHGAEYAETRLWQRWQYSRYRVKQVGDVVDEVEKRIERKYSIERYGYLFVMGLGILAFIANFAAIVNPRVPDHLRMALCFVVPAAIVLIRTYWRHHSDVVNRHQQTRKDLDALHTAFGGLFQA